MNMTADTNYIVNDSPIRPLVEIKPPEDFHMQQFKNFRYHRACKLMTPYVKNIVDIMMDQVSVKKKYQHVDVKVHNLKKYNSTANRLWHLDSSLNPVVEYENYLFVSGTHALTEFVTSELEIPHQESGGSFHRFIEGVPNKVTERIRSCTITEYNGRNIHKSVLSTGRESRLLVRLINTDQMLPTYSIEG